jgi:hypothetical protein
VVHYTYQKAYEKIIATGQMQATGPEGGHAASIFFTDTSPFPRGVKFGTGPYDPEIIAIELGIPNYLSMGAKAAEYYIVVERNRMPGCTWWTRPAGLQNDRLEYNCAVPQVGLVDMMGAIAKHGKTEDLNSGNDVIYPIP